MHHKIITRVSMVLAGLCLFVAAAFAWLVSPAQVALATSSDATSAGAEDMLFVKYCGGCHTQDEMLAILRKDDDLAGNADSMQQFLKRHGKSSDEQDAQIVAALKELAADR